jgi:hypothetical protein
MTPDGDAAASGVAYDRLYLDATVLTSLASADLVGVVPSLFASPRTSYAVRAALDADVVASDDVPGRALAWLRDPLSDDGTDAPGIVVAGSLARQRKPELYDRLAADEASVLYQAWAAGAPLATDDEDVRRVADSYSVPVVGSVAIVARAVDEGELPVERADAALDTWRAGGQRVPVDRVTDLLAWDG